MRRLLWTFVILSPGIALAQEYHWLAFLMQPLEETALNLAAQASATVTHAVQTMLT